MKINDEHTNEFQALYKKHYGLEINEHEAMRQGLCLLQILNAISKYHNKKQSEEFAKKYVKSN